MDAKLIHAYFIVCNCIKHTKISLGIFKRISIDVYHYLTLNVRNRTKNNIPHIHFTKKHVRDSSGLLFISATVFFIIEGVIRIF
jgi:hypothetical protein